MEGSKVYSTKDLETYCPERNASKNYFITSEVPDICRNEPCILGIDEAGRGPVLGPMVYGICYCPKSKEEDLKKTGCDDSKALTEIKRENIFDKFGELNDFIGWDVEVISALAISNSMLRRQKVSLNEVSHNAAIGLIKRAQEAGVKVTEVYVDTVGPAEKYQAKLQAIFPELSITVAKKADSTYPIVSAASICAKVTRDVALKFWKCPELDSENEVVLGSGYPGDPDTKKFIEEFVDPVFGYPSVVRFSWSTAQNMLEKKAVQIDWEDDESPTKAKTPITSFFKKSEKGSSSHEKHAFFKDRHLSNTHEL